MAEQQTQDSYPVHLSVDYPDRPLSRISSFFRIITVIPIAIVLGLVTGSVGTPETAVGAGGLLVLPVLLMILFRQKYPRWWYDWMVEVLKFTNRVTAYAFLMRDEYPSTDEEQSVHLEIPYPNVHEDLNRWLPLVKWLLAIPHYIALIVLGIIMFFVIIIAWFAILLTARYPRGLFDFVEGIMRWSLRVQAYAFALVTDRYPPFRLKD